MPTEQIMFHKGLAWDARSELQQPGFLQTAKNIDFRVDGEQGLRQQFTVINANALNAIHSITRFRNMLFVGDSDTLRYRNARTSGDFTSLGGGDYTDAIMMFREYKDFLVATNGTNSILFDASGNLYNTSISNPAAAPTLADFGVAGNPDDTYVGYVTFLITWPNGHTYETGLSSASADVTVATNKIRWSAIPTCNYTALSGTAPTIHRKLYRGPGTGGTLADIYLVTTITDNTTATYTDDVSDTALAANGASYVDDYTAMPVPLYHEFHYGRWFTINSTNTHRLYYSEPAAGATGAGNELLMPIATKSTNWDDMRVSGFGRCDPQGLIAWGTYLYIPMKQTWLRKYGNDPDTWSYKKTWAEIGISAPHSIVPCGKPTGLLGVSSPKGKVPGISLFNGQLSQIITSPKFDYLFEEDLSLDYIHKCRAAWDGRYYHLVYPSGDVTEPDKWAAFDLSRYPDIKLAYWEDLAGMSVMVDDQSTGVYIGGSDGYARRNNGTETIDVHIRTHDLVGGDPKVANVSKTLKELKYALDTGGENVTLEIYIDDSLVTFSDDTQSKTISGSDDTPQYIKDLPQNAEGYSYSARVSGTDLSTCKIYSPWIMEYEVK